MQGNLVSSPDSFAIVNIIVDTIRSSDVECASIRKHLRVLSYFSGKAVAVRASVFLTEPSQIACRLVLYGSRTKIAGKESAGHRL